MAEKGFHYMGSDPEEQGVPAGRRADGRSAKDQGNDDRGNDLDIEKKWLQLVKIDPERFSYFFDKYHDRIFKFLYWKTSEHDLAAELTDEVFSLAWRNINRFTWQGYSFGAWLFQIARGCLSHEIRRRKVRKETPFDPEIHGQVEEGTPEQEFRKERDRALVRMCLEKLSGERHDVFVLHYWMGMTVDEVALVLKRPRGTVCSHLSRGRQTMLRYLEEHGLEFGLSRKAQQTVQKQLREDSGLKLIDGDVEPQKGGRSGEP